MNESPIFKETSPAPGHFAKVDRRIDELCLQALVVSTYRVFTATRSMAFPEGPFQIGHFSAKLEETSLGMSGVLVS